MVTSTATSLARSCHGAREGGRSWTPAGLAMGSGVIYSIHLVLSRHGLEARDTNLEPLRAALPVSHAPTMGAVRRVVAPDAGQPDGLRAVQRPAPIMHWLTGGHERKRWQTTIAGTRRVERQVVAPGAVLVRRRECRHCCSCRIRTQRQPLYRPRPAGDPHAPRRRALPAYCGAEGTQGAVPRGVAAGPASLGNWSGRKNRNATQPRRNSEARRVHRPKAGL
jgi:hypothetical protein